MKMIKKAEKGGVKFGPLSTPTMTELHSDDTQLSGASLNRRVSLVLIDCGCPAGGGGGGGRSVIVLFSIPTTSVKWILLSGITAQCYF